MTASELAEELASSIDGSYPPDTHYHANRRLRAMLAELEERAVPSVTAREAIASLDSYRVGDSVRIRPARACEWRHGIVVRVESWHKRNGSVGNRVEVSESGPDGIPRYGCWAFEDGDEGALERE